MRILFYIFIFFNFCYSNQISISGTIFNSEGKPSRKAIVTITSLDDLIIATAKTNRKGRFEFHDIIPDFYYLVARHPEDGQVRIKINPREKRNRDLLVRLNLKKEISIPSIYTYSNVKPIEKDPVLRVKNLDTKVSYGSIQIKWKMNRQALKYTIYRDEELIYETEKNVFIDTTSEPGFSHCYEVMAVGKYFISGLKSSKICASSLTGPPTNISSTVYKNDITLKWDKVNGASNYKIVRDGKVVGYTGDLTYKDDSLKFSTKYRYLISSIDSKGIIGLESQLHESQTRDYVEAPELSSYNNEEEVNLIWNDIKLAKSYNIYRDGALISNLTENSYSDIIIPGETHCYQISSIDKYDIESEMSNQYCSKLFLKSPKSLIVNGGIKSNNLSWDNVAGVFEYNLYKSFEKDSVAFIKKVKTNTFLDTDLGYDESHCYLITAIDIEGDESGYSDIACGTTNGPPEFQIRNYKLIEPSNNNYLDSREEGSLRFAILNKGASPSKNIIITVSSIDDDNKNNFIVIDSIKIIENLNIDEAKYFELKIKADLKVKSGDWKYVLNLVDENEFILKDSFEFIINTKSVDKPQIVLADYAIENNFGTNYIPKNEEVSLIVRVQNIGAGLTENVKFNITENHLFSLIDFNGFLDLPKLDIGEYHDIDLKIKSEKEKFAIQFNTIDYLDNEHTHQIDLELMKHYRGKNNLILREIGEKNIIPYPIQFGELEIENNIPIGKRNPSGMAIILAVQDYEDIAFKKPKYAKRDGEILRTYVQNTFGFDDYQIFPSKPWQMEGGPDKAELDKIFDPHQGTIRNRVISSSKYSNIDFVDITVYYSGLGLWYAGDPYLIPKDGNSNQIGSLCALDKILNNLSLLSVLHNIKSITIILDIKYINSDMSNKSWNYPSLSEKICILSASSNGENSIENDELKHSVFSYFLFKGLRDSDSIGSDKILELGELAEYLYRKVPGFLNDSDKSISQNPVFIGTDLKRVLLDLR